MKILSVTYPESKKKEINNLVLEEVRKHILKSKIKDIINEEIKNSNA